MCVDDIFLSVCMLLSSDGVPSSFPYVDGCEVDPSQRLMIAHSAEPIPPSAVLPPPQPLSLAVRPSV